ncbi:hypothetical protein niasHS_012962 [Heterodera schachtii]|uniref:Uncharacterized protein n=1 Tax=Heterodera schachtii TaxID=97005 RepID=A0ABD2IWP2_HETSC
MVRISTRTPPYYHAYASPNGTVLPRVRQTTYASPNGTVPARARHRITMRTPNDVRVTQWNRTSTRTPPYYHATRTPPYYKRTPSQSTRTPPKCTDTYANVMRPGAYRPLRRTPLPPSENLDDSLQTQLRTPSFRADPPPAEQARSSNDGPPPPNKKPLTDPFQRSCGLPPAERADSSTDGPPSTQLRTPSRRAGGQFHPSPSGPLHPHPFSITNTTFNPFSSND